MDAFPVFYLTVHLLAPVIFVVEFHIPGDLTIPAADEAVSVIDHLKSLGKVAKLLVISDRDIIARGHQDSFTVGLSRCVDFSLVVAVLFNLTISPGRKASLCIGFI